MKNEEWTVKNQNVLISGASIAGPALALWLSRYGFRPTVVERAPELGDAAWCSSPLSGMGTGMAIVGAYILAGELKHAAGDYTLAFANCETLMRDYVARCQKIAEGADWWVPRTRRKLWLRNQIWRALPYTPLKNMMLEVPLKAANSVCLRNY